MNIKENSRKLCQVGRLVNYRRSDEVFIRVEVFLASSVVLDVIKFELVPEEAADASETLAVLEAVGRLVGNELDLDTVGLVVNGEPVCQLFLCDHLKVNAGFPVLEELLVLFLLGVQKKNVRLARHWVLDLVAHDFDVLIEEHHLESADLHRLHRVFDSKHDHACVQCDVFKELSDNLLFLHKLDVGQDILRLCDGILETLVHAVGNIERGQYDCG